MAAGGSSQAQHDSGNASVARGAILLSWLQQRNIFRQQGLHAAQGEKSATDRGGEGGGDICEPDGNRRNLEKQQACDARENPNPDQAELSGLLQVVPVQRSQGIEAQNQEAKARRAKKVSDAPA
jgi:hypothetical protein